MALYQIESEDVHHDLYQIMQIIRLLELVFHGLKNMDLIEMRELNCMEYALDDAETRLRKIIDSIKPYNQEDNNEGNK